MTEYVNNLNKLEVNFKKYLKEFGMEEQSF